VRHAIAVASKTGWVYILDRATGKPLLPIPEVKVPQFPKGSPEAKYANLSATQPEPVGDALLNQCAKKSWWPGDAADGKPYTSVGCIFTPYAPSPEGSFAAWNPGAASIDWPPSSYDPQTNDLYVCANETHGFSLGAIPKAEQKLVVGQLYVGVNFSFSKSKTKDAGRVIAVDMATNRIKWKDVFPAACYSGNLTTASGLDFVGQTKPRVLTALDVGSGKKLWSSTELAASPMAPPITYMAGGKQYVLVVAGGGGAGAGLTSGTLGDSIYAFTLSQ
jgi:glucose dehydrogenase